MEVFFERLNIWHYRYFKYVKLAFLLLIVWLIMRNFSTLFRLFAPFLVGYGISKLVEPLVCVLHKYVRLPRFLCSAICVVLCISVLVLVVGWLVVKLGGEFVDFAQNFPALYASARAYADTVLQQAKDWLNLLPDEVVGWLGEAARNLGSTVSDWLGSLVAPVTSGAISVAKLLPSVLVFIVTTVLASFFFSSDAIKISNKLKKWMPKSTNKFLKIFKNEMISALGAYLKAQLKLMGITAVELLIGFILLRQPYAIFLALAVALIDTLPVFGTGTVLIPWALVSFFMRDFRMGIGLAVLYLVCLLVRQLLEPKILGNQIGLHPLVTLTCVYVGLQLFGILGMFLLPVAFLIIRNFYYAGAFDWLVDRQAMQGEEEL